MPGYSAQPRLRVEVTDRVVAVGASYGIHASVQNVSTGVAGYFNGSVSVGGELWAGNTNIIGNFTVFGGSKSVAVPSPDGTHRLLYCLESPQNEGKSTLKFSYRIVGKRKDVKAERFAKVTAPKLPEPPSAAVTKEKGKAKRKA